MFPDRANRTKYNYVFNDCDYEPVHDFWLDGIEHRIITAALLLRHRPYIMRVSCICIAVAEHNRIALNRCSFTVTFPPSRHFSSVSLEVHALRDHSFIRPRFLSFVRLRTAAAPSGNNESVHIRRIITMIARVRPLMNRLRRGCIWAMISAGSARQ